MSDASSNTHAKVDVREVLKGYGWTCGPDFEERYLTDPWVFNLVNIIEKEREATFRVKVALEAVPHDGKHDPGDYPYTCLGCRVRKTLEVFE